MTTEDDVKKESAEEGEPEQSAGEPEADAPPPEDAPAAEEPRGDVAPVGAMSPGQMGTRRFVYAAYFGGAIAIAFVASKVIDFAWFKLQNYKPAIGEPRDEYVMPAAALIGLGCAVYYWYRTRARQLAEEVATEMTKVTWPTRTEVTNGTFVVIVTTIVSTVFFALMDRFWGFVTSQVYGGN